VTSRRDELFAIARSTKGFMPDDEGEALFDAAVLAGLAFDAATMVEVGAWCGKSTVYLGAACEATGAVVVSVDHHRGSEELQEGWADFDPDVVDPRDGRIDTLGHWRRTIADAGLEGSVLGVVADSVAAATHLRPQVALCFIDGGHGHDVAWADYAAWTPLIVDGGYLCLHDVFEDPADGGRPPYELYVEATGTGFEEVSATGSLRVLRRASARGAGR
jgi:predicted O-methyltransferase YrrM